MLVETVWFNVGIRLDGRTKTSLSIENPKDAALYEMTAIPAMQILSIKRRVPPLDEVWVPFVHCKFIKVKPERKTATAKPKAEVKPARRRATRRPKTTVKPSAEF